MSLTQEQKQAILKIVYEQAGKKEEPVPCMAGPLRLAHDLGLDSLDVVTIMMWVEELIPGFNGGSIDFEVPDTTVDELITAIEKQMEKENARFLR